eukprot:scaffold4542_cov80-Isochrysis_galbana.AAC.2
MHREADHVVVAAPDARYKGTAQTLDAIASGLIHWLSGCNVAFDSLCGSGVLSNSEQLRPRAMACAYQGQGVGRGGEVAAGAT